MLVVLDGKNFRKIYHTYKISSSPPFNLGDTKENASTIDDNAAQ
jgi:hypothetical protein